MAVYTPEKPLTAADISGPGAWWCSGCGDFGVTAAFKDVVMTLVNELGVPLERIFIMSGIGCSSKEPEMLRLNSYHGQHGRSIPVAMGVALANPNLVVVDFGGDGDTYAEVARRTFDWMLTEMRLPEGGFASALDADIKILHSIYHSLSCFKVYQTPCMFAGHDFAGLDVSSQERHGESL